jgi:hypothetical protein
MSNGLEARQCIRAFLGDGVPTPEILSRLMEHFYVHDFTPLSKKVNAMSDELGAINGTLHEWQAQLRILVIICTILGGLISAAGTVLGIYFTLHGN